MKNVFFVAVAMLVSLPVFSEDIPGQNLLSYFSANCKRQGEWTRAALADSTALIESLRSIQNDSDCKSVSGAIAQLGLLNTQLSRLDSTNETQSKLSELNSQEQELLIQISNNSDPTTLADINAKLRELQVLRAGYIGKDKANSELSSPNKAAVLTDIVQIANATYGQVASNQKCLAKNPNILNTATSVMASIGATASVVNPALGLGLTAGATLLGETIEGVRKHYNNREIRKISDNTIASEAYKCALETMSDRWCQMRDAQAFLQFKADQRTQPRMDRGLQSAIRLNDREIPVLIEWLNKIRSGVTPTSTADAARQNAVREREGYVQGREAFGLGLIEETRQVYQQEQNEIERWNILRGLIKQLVPAEQAGWKNPLHDTLGSVGYPPFFLLGLPDDASIKNPQTGAYHTLDTWPKPSTFNPTLDLVKENYIQWISKTRIRVNQELSTVLQPDALQTLSSAYDRTGNRWKISPMDSLKNLITFLKANPPRESDFAFRKLYSDTMKKLETVYGITETAVIMRDLDGVSPVEEIYNAAQLRFGTVVIEARLEMIVRLSLLEFIENSSPEDQVLVAQLLAAERFTETITRMNGTDNLAKIDNDIKNGQTITIANLNAFIDIFGNNINRILQKLKWDEEAATGTVAKSKRHARTEMCFLLLSVPDLNSYVDARLCEGLKIAALVKGGPESFTITPKTFTLDINDRACEYREYFRKSKIYETWGIK
jgi:hypothetical protein